MSDQNDTTKKQPKTHTFIKKQVINITIAL